MSVDVRSTEEILASALNRSSGDGLIGTTIGGYTLLEVIGHGGFSVVYRAQQRAPVERTVAVKVLKPGMDSASVLRRFEQERHVLASLDHHAIATVYDAGITATGTPYVVMEYVDGVALTTFCGDERLGIANRLQCVLQVCDAVLHAHARLVVHRDLKPSNLLVSRGADGAPSARVIDFGIAKVLGPGSDGVTMTIDGHRVGTPAYMSPEQARGVGAIDVRTDVYSLGVVLYELMVGQPPFEIAGASHATPDGMMGVVAESAYDRPSVAVRKIRATSPERLRALAHERRLDPEMLLRRLENDVDWIVMKCLAPEPDDRYESVSELAADLRRFLAHEPVLAGPPGRRYRLKKFVERNRPFVGAAAAVFVVLVLATIVSLVFAYRTQLARERELQVLGERDRLIQRLKRSTGVDESDRSFHGMMDDLLRVSRMTHGSDDIVTLAALEKLAVSHRCRGDLAAAELAYRELVERGAYVLRTGSPHHTDAKSELARVLWRRGRPMEAEPLLRTVVAERTDTLGATNQRTLEAKVRYGSVLRVMGRTDEAIVIVDTVLHDSRATVGENSDEYRRAARELAHLELARGQPDVATDLAWSCERILESLDGNGHWWRGAMQLIRARAMVARGEFVDAERLMVAIQETYELHLPIARPHDWVDLYDAKIDLYRAWGRDDDAAMWSTRLESLREGLQLAGGV